MAGVLDSIPGLGGYLGMRNQLQGDQMAQLQQMQALGGLLGQFQSQALQEQQIKMAQQKAAKEQMFMDLAMRSMGPQQDPRAIPALAAGAQGEGPTVAAADRMAAMPMPGGTKQGPDLGLIQAMSLINPAAGSALLKVHQEMNPGLKVDGGYVYDPRALQAGQFLPQVKTSQDGKASMLTPTPGGGLQMSPVPGAVGTFGSFEDRANESRARFDLVERKPISPDAAPEYRSRLELLGGAPAVPVQNPPTSAAPAPAAGMPDVRAPGAGQAPAGSRERILSQELASEQAALQDATQRGDMGAVASARRNIASIERELGGVRTPSAGGGVPAGMSPNEQARQENRAAFGKTMNQDAAKSFVTLHEDTAKATQALPFIQESRKALQSGIITGMGANFRQDFGRALNLAGFQGAQNEVENTQVFASTMARQVLPLVKALGAGTAISNADREFVEKMVGGNISLEKGTMQRLLDISEKAITLQVKNVNERMADFQDIPGIVLKPIIIPGSPDDAIRNSRGSAGTRPGMVQSTTQKTPRVIDFSTWK